MKARVSLFFSLLTGLLIFGAFYYPSVNNAQKEAIIMQTLINGLNQLHYRPVKLNDDFSKKAFNLYIDRLDGLHRFFTQSEIEQLKNYEYKIDDEINASTYQFFDLSYNLYTQAIKRVSGFYKDLLKEPFDFSKPDAIETDGDKRAYPKNEKELKAFWRKWFKYETMIRLSDKLEEQKNEQDESVEKKSIPILEKEARKAVEERYDRLFERMAKDRRSDRLSDYLNAITNVYDPHTGYFAPKDKANFDISMSGTLEGIGARLQEDGEFTKVSSIVPGGPAWKQKGLEVDDKIVKVAQGDNEALDVTGMRVDDVVKYIRGKKGTVVKLTVKKVDGTTQVIPITRDVVIIGESFAKSLIIETGEEIGKVGYIRLPRFYADFNRRGGRSCATDVAKEVAKLKAENVNGIIIDLRNNGGGSLRDVVRMSGLFIEEGPIVQVKAKEGKAEVLSDKDPRVQYDGPLVVMVNTYSASASEIMAAALQDYGRAIIVGSNSTFGKGTVQRFFDLDRAIRGFNEIKPLGEVKLTIQKFYRVNGGSTQLKGVIPDIILPDRYHYLKDLGEKEHEFPLEWTEIDPVDYSQSVSSLDNLAEVKAASNQRVAHNETFQMILKSAKRLKEQREDTNQTLNLDEYQKWADELEVASKKYKKIAEKEVIPNVRNIKVDLTEIEKDESKQARNEDWIKAIKKDIYIEEVLNIMRDMTKKQ
ncbi:MAG TPA: tail-specific protease [Saprospiraceae bacterium]|nr:tail-specific protease [Saprospiraceae bacterium]